MVAVTELTMAINSTFTSILNEIQLFNLNFSIQMTPFAAYITLKRSVQKDLNGEHATPSPPILVLLQHAQQEILHLQNKNFQLESAVASLEKKCESIALENAHLVEKNDEINKNAKALTATKNILLEKINEGERKAEKQHNENRGFEFKLKEMKKN